MSGRIEIRHDRLRHSLNVLLCFSLIGIFAWHALAGTEGALLLLVPAVVLFGGTAIGSLVKILDRRPVIVLDRTGLSAPTILARPLPWDAIQRIEERRFGRTRLFFYVDEPKRWLRVDASSGRDLLSALLPGFERPRIVLDTSWLDHSHKAIREAVAGFWGAARSAATLDDGVADASRDPFAHKHCCKDHDQDRGYLRPGEHVQ